jgi:hypothetical protein
MLHATHGGFLRVDEIDKPLDQRVYHNNSSCPSGCGIKEAKEDTPGTGGYQLCRDCDTRNGPAR